MIKVYPKDGEQVYALNDLSLEVYPGEMVAIVGRRGSGKTSLLSILGCLERPDSGRVRIEDTDVTQLSDEELARVRVNNIGYVSQDAKLEPKDTALANVEVTLSVEGMEELDRRRTAREALRLVGLESRVVEQKLGLLSTSQRKAIAVAQALVHDPTVLFADEPTRGLDAVAREELMAVFQKLNEDGRTIIITTADAGVGSHCRRLVRLAEGKTGDDGLVPKRRIILSSGSPAAVPAGYARGEETNCPRCNYSNPLDEGYCQRCQLPLRQSEEGEGPVGGRQRVVEIPSPADVVESPSPVMVVAAERGEVSGQVLLEELKLVPFFARLGTKSLVKLMPSME